MIPGAPLACPPMLAQSIPTGTGAAASTTQAACIGIQYEAPVRLYNEAPQNPPVLKTDEAPEQQQASLYNHAPKTPPVLKTEAEHQSIVASPSPLLKQSEAVHHEEEAEEKDSTNLPEQLVLDHYDWTYERPSKRRWTGSYEDDEVLKSLPQDDEYFPKEIEDPDDACILEGVVEVHQDDENGNNMDVFCHAVNHWKPFVNKVGKYMMSEKVPFEYFDIWVPDETASSSVEGGDDVPKPHESYSSDTSHVKLRHVGHGTNCHTEVDSIFTMYQMNQFGNLSERYSFSPGTGLPGRVYTSRYPIWDDSLQVAPFRDFPRRKLAQKFGLKLGLAIPLMSPIACDDGQQHVAIIAMYSTEYCRRPEGLVQNMYQALSTGKFHGPPALCAPPQLVQDRESSQDDENNSRASILPDKMDIEMAYVMERHFKESGVATPFALVSLLWRPPIRRTKSENANINSLKRKYLAIKQSRHQETETCHHYNHHRPQNDVAKQIFQEWLALHEGR